TMPKVSIAACTAWSKCCHSGSDEATMAGVETGARSDAGCSAAGVGVSAWAAPAAASRPVPAATPGKTGIRRPDTGNNWSVKFTIASPLKHQFDGHTSERLGRSGARVAGTRRARLEHVSCARGGVVVVFRHPAEAVNRRAIHCQVLSLVEAVPPA